MIKLQSLRQHLLASVEELRRNPEQLHTFVNDGKVMFSRGTNLSHQYTVDAQIIITDYSGSLDTVMIPLLQWLNTYQPDLVEDEAVQIEAEILSNTHWDLALTVRLTERVVAKVNCETSDIDAHHRMPEYPADACPATSWQLNIKHPGSEEFTQEAAWDSPA
ncbi:phage tail protein [Vreelandella neptunia]|uniref:Phage tail protein n=1 Tax=Vreelandella neptunia TaxID=115551 RepID=A0ABZ0YKK7_9GAMM|nr:phage tail protein [Halomonas neptunia]MDN3562110.1 phage tail protein [Halomonas neptunia]WQH11812.1 phage tail protein [Halomonas neptunia]